MMSKLSRLALFLAAAATFTSATASAQTIYSSANTAAFNYTTFTGSFVGTGLDTLTFATFQEPSFYLLDNIVIPGVSLINPSFETGDFTGYAQSGDLSFTGVSGQFDGVNPTDGSFQAYFGSTNGIGYTSQTFADVAGQTYSVSFDLADLDVGPSSFTAYIDSPTNVTATPEPSSLVLLGTGVLSLAGAARRKFRKA